MQIPGHVFREYDIRGHASDDLSDDLVNAIGRAFASELRARAGSAADSRISVAVARDCRLSGDRLFAALCAGLNASGADVVDSWRREGVIGSRPDIEDSQAHARSLRRRAKRRGAE